MTKAIRTLLCLAALLLGPPVPADSSEEPPLAVINGEPLGPANLQAYRMGLPDGPNGPEKDREVLLEELINRELLLKEARQRGLPHEDPVRRAIERARQDVLIDALLDRVTAERVTGQRVRSYYQEHFTSPDQVVRLELTEIPAASRKEAASLRKSLAKGAGEGTDGAIPPSARKTSAFLPLLPLGIQQTVADSSAGEVAGPVARAGKWWIFRVEARQEVEPPSLKEVREGVEERLRARAIRIFLGKLRESAEIEYP